MKICGRKMEDRKSYSRINALDTLRGYCVLLMIAWHYYFFLRINSLETEFFIVWVMNVIGIVGNPIFIIVMGVSLVLSIDKRKKKGENFKNNLIHLSKRAILFFVVHHIMVISYFLYFGPTIFQMPHLYPGWIPSLGINAVICFFLMYSRKLYRFSLMLGLEFIDLFNLLPGFGIYINSLFHMIFGTIIGELIICARMKGNLRSLLKKFFISGLILIIVGIPSEYYVSLTYDLTIPNNNVLHSPFFIIYALGFFILAFSILFWIQDLNANKNRVFQPIVIFSSLSLTLYYAHYVLGTNFFLPFGFGNLLSLYSYVIFLMSFYIIVYLFGVLWSRSRFKYSLEWIIRTFS